MSRSMSKGWPVRLATLGLAFVLAAVLGCTTPADSVAGKKTAVGGLGGAVAGGLLGSALGGHTGGVVAGVLLGGLVGGAVGNVLDQRDHELATRNAMRTLEYAPTGQTSTWSNPDNGHAGNFTPTRTYQEPSGRYCREYQQEITVGGQRHQSYGTACRQPDGSWQIQN